MTPEELAVFSAIVTPVVTAFLTSYATAKANERVLRNIMDRVDELENRIFNHEKRIARLEGREAGA
ncbi:hypothetical protein [Thermococcus nautili]|uniref:C-terminal coiled-coil domain protein n=1 Tax=Thermococcus nautili TaxID=195522 RepID=U3RJB8_9EURY|nr:hypothetical protein [Thermococcus nautili]AGX15337.1 C-terminal coiled-coil domain protein [Thermococcus nautili]AHL23864.1 C-terminal coiled-coil domain protein [Thermococcus nautili]